MFLFWAQASDQIHRINPQEASEDIDEKRLSNNSQNTPSKTSDISLAQSSIDPPLTLAEACADLCLKAIPDIHSRINPTGHHASKELIAALSTSKNKPLSAVEKKQELLRQQLTSALHPHEQERLEATRALNLADIQCDPRFDCITEFIRISFDVPLALITLIYKDQIQILSKSGDWVDTAPRIGSICDWCLMPAKPQVLLVENMLHDPRFKNNHFVTGPLGVRFYLGGPLVGSQNGLRYGTLAILDFKPRKFSAEKMALLADFTEIVVRELERDGCEKWMKSIQLFDVEYDCEGHSSSRSSGGNGNDRKLMPGTSSARSSSDSLQPPIVPALVAAPASYTPPLPASPPPGEVVIHHYHHHQFAPSNGSSGSITPPPFYNNNNNNSINPMDAPSPPRFVRSVDSIQEGILLCEVSQPQWPIRYANSAWTKATGLGYDETVKSGKGLWELFSGGITDLEEVKAAWVAVQQREPFNITLKIRNKKEGGKEGVFVLKFQSVSGHMRPDIPKLEIPYNNNIQETNATNGRAAAAEGITDAANGISTERSSSSTTTTTGTGSAAMNRQLSEDKASALVAALASLKGKNQGGGNAMSNIGDAAEAVAAAVQGSSPLHDDSTQPPPERQSESQQQQQNHQQQQQQQLYYFAFLQSTDSVLVDTPIPSIHQKQQQNASLIPAARRQMSIEDDKDWVQLWTPFAANDTITPSTTTTNSKNAPANMEDHHHHYNNNTMMANCSEVAGSVVKSATTLNNANGLAMQQQHQRGNSDNDDAGSGSTVLAGRCESLSRRHSTHSTRAFTQLKPPSLEGLYLGHLMSSVSQPSPVAADTGSLLNKTTTTSGAGAATASHATMYEGRWHGEKVRVKIIDNWVPCYSSPQYSVPSSLDTTPRTSNSNNNINGRVSGDSSSYAMTTITTATNGETNEALLSQHLQHPGLLFTWSVGVAYGGVDDENRQHQQIWLVQEYLEPNFKSLAGIITSASTCTPDTVSTANGGGGGCVDLSTVLQTGLDIAHTLGYLHSQGVVLGGFTSSDIAIVLSNKDQRGWVPKFSNLGGARIMEDDEDCMTGNGNGRGGRVQSRRGSAAASIDDDIIALGVVLLECITGKKLTAAGASMTGNVDKTLMLARYPTVESGSLNGLKKLITRCITLEANLNSNNGGGEVRRPRIVEVTGMLTVLLKGLKQAKRMNKAAFDNIALACVLEEQGSV